MTENTKSVLVALRANAESDYGEGWWGVYIDNAMGDLKDMNRRAFAAHCSNLKKAGLYRDHNEPEWKGVWGFVKLEEVAK